MNRDALLHRADREEALSTAYALAVASAAGYTVSVENFDRSGVDLRIHAGGFLNPEIALQLKATVRLGAPGQDGCYRYPAPIGNYRRLIAPSQVPRYLVVLELPNDESEWLTVSAEELVIRRCAYWVSLLDMPESDNRHSVTVSLPAANRFDPDALRELLESSRRGFHGRSESR